jgi:tetratricopeptide (TPR) repeat protein/peroxiredoxin
VLDFGDVPLFREAIVLTPPEPKHSRPKVFEANSGAADLSGFDAARRRFLVQGCQSAAAAFLPSGLGRYALPSILPVDSSAVDPIDHQFHLHPHYRTQPPLDATLLKTGAGFDKFTGEKYHDQLAAILAEWSAALLRSPLGIDAIAKVLSPDFCATSLHSVTSHVVRSGPALEILRNTPNDALACGREPFLNELRSAMSSFSSILTAEFEITSIGPGSGAQQQSTTPTQLKTRVRYTVVGSGLDFYREQRTGNWDLEWQTSSGAADFQLRSWKVLEEIRSRCKDPAFLDISARTFKDTSSYSAQLSRGSDYWRTVLDGACGIDIYGHNGVSVGDIDGDGLEDLYVCQPGGLPNRLYRNRGDSTFEDITEASGVGILENTACALFVDVDNDGRQDLIVVCTDGPLLFLNQGGGKFRQKPDAFQFATSPQGTFAGAAAADYDKDGWLDIYFCLYVYYQGADQYRYPLPYFDAENGPPNFMMRNQRDGTFRDVTASTGLDRNNTRYSFCCGWSDYNRDGWPDLYVVNDFGRKNLYRNNGDGTFTDVAPQTGVEDIGAGMSVSWLDYDNDGIQDIYVADMWSAAGNRLSMQELFQEDAPPEVRALYRKHARGNSLFRNQEGKMFTEAGASAGVEMGRWSWSSDAWDFDHDGFPDLYIANGMVSGPSREDLDSFFWRHVVANSPATTVLSRAYEQGWNALNELIRSDATWSGYQRNVFYANNRDGTFSDVSGAVGLDFLEDGRAFALADFDLDGRLEVFLKSRNGPQLRVLKNEMDLPPSLSFRLQGRKSNRDAIGAEITLAAGTSRQTRIVQAGSGFLSQHTKEVFFGLGDVKGPVQASIRWPTGLVQELTGLPVNHRIWVEEGADPTKIEPFRLESARQGERNPATSGPPELLPELLPTTAETWLVAPFSAPDFSLPDLDGQTHTLSALRGRPVLLNFWTSLAPACRQQLKMFGQNHARPAPQGITVLAVNIEESARADNLRLITRQDRISVPVLLGSDDVAGIYNIVYRYLFDRHRDLTLPTSMLLDENGEIVKIYQGLFKPEQIEEDCSRLPRTPAERIAKALPFPGVTDTLEFRRNYLSYGTIFFQHGYLDQAVASYRLSLRDDPSSAEASYGVGSVYLNQQKNLEAQESFRRALQLHASYPDTLPNAWNNLGIIAGRQGNTDEAVRDFEQALALSPNHLIALENLGNAYRQSGRWEDARQVLQRAVDIDPDDPEANYSLAMVYAQTNDNNNAYEYLQRALKLRPAYPEALNNLGILYLRTRRVDEAVSTFEDCIRSVPDFDQAYLNLATVYTLENQSQKARTVLLALLKQHPGHPAAQKALAQLPH